jgi:hypothetical protein
MAGENVPETVVRKVFASSLDLVIHLDRMSDARTGAIVRQVVEIRALVPSLHDDFSTEPLYVRDRIGAPMEWTGALPPPPLSRQLARFLPEGQSLSSIMGAGP